jgi:hypothetical protein
MKKLLFVIICICLYIAGIAQEEIMHKVENMEFVKTGTSSTQIKREIRGLRQSGTDVSSFLDSNPYQKPIQVMFTFCKTDNEELVNNFDMYTYLKQGEKGYSLFMGKIRFVPEKEVEQVEINGRTFDQYEGKILKGKKDVPKTYIKLITTVIDNERYYAYSVIYSFGKRETWENIKKKSLFHSTRLLTFNIKS